MEAIRAYRNRKKERKTNDCLNLAELIPNHFLFLISFSVYVYKNANDFCVFIFYPMTSLYSVSSSNSLVASLGFSMYSIMSSSNSENFTFFQSGFLLFVFLL